MGSRVAAVCCSSAWYELLTNGPEAICLNPRFSPSSFSSSNSCGVSHFEIGECLTEGRRY